MSMLCKRGGERKEFVLGSFGFFEKLAGIVFRFEFLIEMKWDVFGEKVAIDEVAAAGGSGLAFFLVIIYQSKGGGLTSPGGKGIGFRTEEKFP